MKNNKIFIACDTSNLNLVKKIIKHTKHKKIRNYTKIWITILL